MKTSVQQGCMLSPLLFKYFMGWILRALTEMPGGGLHMEYTTSGGQLLPYILGHGHNLKHSGCAVCGQSGTGCKSQEGATAHPGVLDGACTGGVFARMFTGRR